MSQENYGIVSSFSRAELCPYKQYRLIKIINIISKVRHIFKKK